MKQDKIIFKITEVCKWKNFKSVSDKLEKRHQMGNTGIMQPKYEGRIIYSPRNTKQTKLIHEDEWNCRQDTALQFYIYAGMPASSSCPSLMLLEIWKKGLIFFLLYLHEWSGLSRHTAVRYFSRQFSRSWEASWTLNIVDSEHFHTYPYTHL